MKEKLPYQKKVAELLGELKVDPNQGLTGQEAQERFRRDGPNKIADSSKQSLLSIYINQFKSPLIYILVLAAVAMLFVGEKSDAILIVGIVFINGLIGTFQEGRARNSLEKLKSLTKHKALVRRDGKEIICSSEELVVGDIVILHEGDVVEADGRVIKSEVLTTDEAILTGEAFPIEKTVSEIETANLVVGDQRNMVFAGTNVSSGYGEMLVVATGFNSELGKISKELLATSSITLPLENKVAELSRFITIAVLIVATFVFLVGIFRGIGASEIFGAVVGLSVSVIPEGLPVVVTIVLARGVWRMAKSKAIVRQMAAVEAMGGADTLLVDKTGTITTGKMIIREVFFDSLRLRIGGEGYEPEGKVDGEENKKLLKLLEITYLSLRADVVREKDLWTPIGDPTEAAIAVLCRKFGLDKERLLTSYETIFTKPFNSQKRYIEAAFSSGKEEWKIFVGAPDFLGRDLKLEALTRENKDPAREGKRVVALVLFGPKEEMFAYALVVMEEEIRTEVASSVAEAKKVGFRVVMMTGDFPATAKTIASSVGIFSQGDSLLTGEEVEKLSEEELKEKIEHVAVFARITPEHKLKIVKAFKAKGHVAAMTGDGVNDAPALQAASLGIGLGSGTQVAKDAADIVLVDNNFSTIVGAIAEGRAIYLTLKKVILYLFSTSFGEVLVIAGAIILGLPLPLLAAQIIWLNFVTDGFLDVSLAQDPPEKNLTKRLDARSLIDTEMLTRIFIMGITMFFSVLPIFYYLVENYDITYARSFTLLIMCMIQWFNALNVRSVNKSIFKMPLTNNYFLILSFGIVFALQLFALQTDLGNRILHTESLGLKEWLLATLASIPIIIVEETRKRFFSS